MTTKLTLSVDHQTIERAKEYAHEKGISVSKLVENYLNVITTRTARKKSKGPSDLMKLKGILGKVSTDFNYDDAKYDYLKTKHNL